MDSLNREAKLKTHTLSLKKFLTAKKVGETLQGWRDKDRQKLDFLLAFLIQTCVTIFGHTNHFVVGLHEPIPYSILQHLIKTFLFFRYA